MNTQKIEVIHVGAPWKPSDNTKADPLYTITIKGMSEPQKTYDPKLTELGVHEAESFTAKNGKVYWRTPKQTEGTASGGSGSQYKADPAKLELGGWQTAMNNGRLVVRDFYELKSMSLLAESVTLEDYKKLVVNATITMAKAIEVKPKQLVESTAKQADLPLEDSVVDAGDFAKINPEEDPDLPPVELYDEQIPADEPDVVVDADELDSINLDEIPF